MALRVVILVVAMSVLAACQSCDCDAPGATYLYMEGFDEVAQADYGDFSMELCVDSHNCRSVSPSSGNQIRSIVEVGYSEEAPTTGFTIRVVGTVESELDQDDFIIGTVESEGCCAGYYHEVRLP